MLGLPALKKRIGQRIRQRRSELKLSQEEVAFKAGISPTYLSQLEGGLRNPSLETLHSLSSALQLDLSELVKS
jgi:transcriptional regulator with XRE-family HTH domain